MVQLNNLYHIPDFYSMAPIRHFVMRRLKLFAKHIKRLG